MKFINISFWRLAFFVFGALGLVAHGYGKAGPEIDIKLSCIVDGMQLDGTKAKSENKEEIFISVKRIAFGNDKNGKPQFGSSTKTELLSNGKKVDASLVGNSDAHVVIAYSDLIKQGISSYLLTILYEIDTQTLSARRSVSIFPTGDVVSKLVKCKKQ